AEAEVAERAQREEAARKAREAAAASEGDQATLVAALEKGTYPHREVTTVSDEAAESSSATLAGHAEMARPPVEGAIPFAAAADLPRRDQPRRLPLLAVLGLFLCVGGAFYYLFRTQPQPPIAPAGAVAASTATAPGAKQDQTSTSGGSNKAPAWLTALLKEDAEWRAQAAAKKAAEEAAQAAAAKKAAEEKAQAAAAKQAAEERAREAAAKKAAEQAREAAAAKQAAEEQAREAATRIEASHPTGQNGRASQPEQQAMMAPPPRPAPARPVIFGKWCSGSTVIHISRANWTFQISGGNAVTFPVVSVAEGPVVRVTFQVPEQSAITIEFGSFSADGNTMIEMRGRARGQQTWHPYNRTFTRCG
ncbi:MAG TPA: hypothetical protein VND95_03530, partial [Stellaceae bacterium]|nr:hypothetical protein [Stellaceae bacterium]